MPFDGPTPGSSADLVDDADPVSVARAICLRQLTLGPRTRSQLADALKKCGVDAGVAAQVLDRFTDVGLIDDNAFAEQWVESRRATKGLARRALAQELRRKGVADDVASDALDAIDPDDERQSARALVERKLAATRGLDAAARMRRLSGMLARKGYPAGVAFAVIREALDAEGADAIEVPSDAFD